MSLQHPSLKARSLGAFALTSFRSLSQRTNQYVSCARVRPVNATASNRASPDTEIRSLGALRKKSGFLLIELTIALSAFLVLVAGGLQVIKTGFDGERRSAERAVVEENFDVDEQAIRLVADARWSDVGQLATSTPYSISSFVDGANITASSSLVRVMHRQYKQWFELSYISRDQYGGIDDQYNPARRDRGVIRVRFVADGGSKETRFTRDVYLYRFRNLVCAQTSFSKGTSGGVVSCESADGGAGERTSITGGESLMLCNNCN